MSKKRGRPAGSRNQALQQYAVEIPPTCNKCGCATLLNVKGRPAIRRQISGVFDGHTYTHFTKRIKQCAECSQRVAVTSYFVTSREDNNIAGI